MICRLACGWIVFTSWVSGLAVCSAQSPARMDGILRDLGAGLVRSEPTGESEPWGGRNAGSGVIQVAASNSKPVGPAIPAHLLPEIYVAEPVSDSGRSESVVYEEYVPDRFIFSSAYQRKQSGPRGDFSSLADDCGCCDEWQTFCECQDCCRDLGLNPWVWNRARPNCPPKGWPRPHAGGSCGRCGGGCLTHDSWMGR